MKFNNSFIPGNLLWSSPFIRWQGSTADVSAVELAFQVTRDALAARGFDASQAGQLVFGSTVPQKSSFFGTPWLAARLGLHAGGPMLSQACATSVACITAAAAACELGDGETQLVVTADRISNGPLLVYPRTSGMGGSPLVENWVIDNFGNDPWTNESMIFTAEMTARDGGISREACDEVTLLRYRQYTDALANDRAVQKRYFQPIVIEQRKSCKVLDADEGVHEYSEASLKALKPTTPGGVVTSGAQTHPADGAAGIVVTSADRARALSSGAGVVRLISAGFARAEKGRMPKAPALALMKALDAAGMSVSDVASMTTHNPFAVNDLWLHQATRFPLEKMNPFGCSLIYGHPQAPTGMRAIVELVESLRMRGGGIGAFTGCAAGDMGAAVVISLE